MTNIAIIGGGVAGGTAAFYLAQLGLNVTLFEKNEGLISGPPFCHLHAGGNLYREIPYEQCATLLHQSIDLLRFYPYAIDFRPTVIITPTSDDHEPRDLLPRLKRLQRDYAASVAADPLNEVLGEPEAYFKVYEHNDLIALQDQTQTPSPQTLDEWMVPVIKHIDLDQVKFPIVIVQEYGLNLFRLAAGLSLRLEESPHANVRLGTTVTKIEQNSSRWSVTFEQNGTVTTQPFDYLINAAGFKTGTIDDMLGLKRQRFVEFKAAYLTRWKDADRQIWPEVIFHGKRGTPQGMGQFTPYPDGYFQLHGMTEAITLFDDGLVKSTGSSAQPRLGERYIRKIDHAWKKQEIEERTRRAITHLSRFIPAFDTAKVASKPLYGAQQIPGEDKELRAADVTFDAYRYARCEVVKASSVLTMLDAIVAQLIKLGWVDPAHLGKRMFGLEPIDEPLLLEQAQQLCEVRDYPRSLAKINTPKALPALS
jgi:2-polyprenyl-6-methoxyphenol hydroxylase-like FAD-dependent oxidoreductase